MQPHHIPKAVADLRRRQQDTDPEAGQAVSEVVMYGAVIVGVIVVIGAALQALGLDIVSKIGEALGI
jgi:hypothetical protein